MDGKIALEEHFSTELNNTYWDAKGEEGRNGRGYAADVERRLLDPELCVREMDRAGIELCIDSAPVCGGATSRRRIIPEMENTFPVSPASRPNRPTLY